MKWAAIVMRTILLIAIWWMLTGGETGAWGVGAVAVILALLVSVRLLPPAASKFSMTGFLLFYAFFLRMSVKGGVQVASMALRPNMNLHPAILDIPMCLPTQNQQLLLASTLNLLPGTLSVNVHNNCLQLHVLDSRMPIEQEVREAEKKIARMFGKRLQ